MYKTDRKISIMEWYNDNKSTLGIPQNSFDLIYCKGYYIFSLFLPNTGSLKLNSSIALPESWDTDRQILAIKKLIDIYYGSYI